MSATPEYLQPGKSQWIGKSVRRLEDQHLMTGRGTFTDDVSLPGEAHCAFARSPHAHARIARIDATAARRAPGVIAVFTGDDLIADGVQPLPFAQMHKRPDGAPIVAPPRYPLTADEARFVGNAWKDQPLFPFGLFVHSCGKDHRICGRSKRSDNDHLQDSGGRRHRHHRTFRSDHAAGA